MTILDEILANKRVEVDRAAEAIDPDSMRERARAATDPTRGFMRALRSAPAPAVIAEIKRRSPSRGLIRADFEPAALARDYARGGAAALSVLTDEHFFGGRLEFLRAVRDAVALPLLRKDFVIDPYQIDETRVAGADALLLIVTALAPDVLKQLHDQARALSLDVLVEVHDEAEMELALGVGAHLIGVNNRDLRTFDVDHGTTERLASELPPGTDVVLVAESGIAGPDDIERLTGAGAGAFLVGESLMREPDVGLALEKLRRVQ
ncbi:MAG: indole-3-glycerol phosphate synthase TrpC [Deltaproteobacteria bacterium]|nr:indole-3-glycerol phosphate synthase TrpC [Deltaproteobacteria bacterium]